MKLPNYTEINEDGKIYLKGIDLEDSWLLAMSFDEKQRVLALNVDLSVWPESKYYKTPLSVEWTCYRKAKINFIGVREINGLFKLEEIKPTTDTTGEKDWDCIYGLRVDAQLVKFEICDREISLSADEMQVIID